MSNPNLPFLPGRSGVVPADAHPVYHLQAAEQNCHARGLNVDVQPDPGQRGHYWIIKCGMTVYRGLNTPAALAFLDGVIAGADEQARVTAARLGGA